MRSLAKRLVLVFTLLFVFSSVAAAINFSSMSMTVRGQNIWTKGVRSSQTNTDARTMVLSSSGSGWTARAEFSSTQSALNNTLSKWNFQTQEAGFKLNLWGRSHRLAHYNTPFDWVHDDRDAASNNWKARVTTPILGGESVFTIDNSAATYYAFYKRAFGDTTFGVAHRTNFKHVTASSAWAISKLPGVTVTGEVATDGTWDAEKKGTKLAPKYGLQGVFGFGLTLKGSYVTGTKRLIVEATHEMTDKLSRYYGKYDDNNGTKQIIGDVIFRAKNDQALTRTFTTNDTYYNIGNAGSNYWMTTTGWAAGAKVTRNLDTNYILDVNGFYEFVPAKVKALATVKVTVPDTGDLSWNLVVRGLYKANNKFSVIPRVTVDKTWVKAGTYLDYVVNRGRIVGGVWYDYNLEDQKKSQERFELGWSIGL